MKKVTYLCLIFSQSRVFPLPIMQLEVPYAMTTDSAYSHLLCSFNQPGLNTMDLHSWHLYVLIFDVLVTNWGPTDRVLFM